MILQRNKQNLPSVKGGFVSFTDFKWQILSILFLHSFLSQKWIFDIMTLIKK